MSAQTAYAYVLVGLAVVVAVGVAVAAWRDRDRRDPAPIVVGGVLPDGARSWLVDGVRVRHDVLGLGTVVDSTPTHAPGRDLGLYVLVRFDATSEPRWIGPRELDPVTADDERLLRAIAERRPRLLIAGGMWPQVCGADGECFTHALGCGEDHPAGLFCCAGCPARRGGGS